MSDKKEKSLISVSLLGAFAASLCCITPILALIAGLGGFASTFSWLDPLRPFLIIFTVLVLSFAWFQKLKPKKEIDCECEDENKSSFLQSKIFLGWITFFAIVMMTFPYYSNQLFSNKNLQINNVTNNYLQNIEFKIVGMTCDGCETFIEQTVSALEGVYSVKANYENGTANISFDSTKTNAKEITYIIEETSYKVSGYAKTNRK